MKLLKRIGPVLLAGLLCGCFQGKDELTLQPDGSGTVRLTMHTDLSAELLSVLHMSVGSGAGTYPPLNEADAKRFFPAKDFLVTVEEKGADESKTIVIEAKFKDINALLASSYGRAHQLSLQVGQSGALVLKSLSACEPLARAAAFKAEGPMAEMVDMQMPGMQDAQKKKGEMRFEFRVTLPNIVTDANGAKEGKTVTWTTERAKCKDDEEFASKLGSVLEARCAAEGLTFSPVTPPRLGLLPFSQLAAGKFAGTTPPVDTNKVAAAARFVPYALHVTRLLDLSGEGSGRASQAQLVGVVTVPAELAPQRWGEVKLEEAVDAKGNNLVPKEENDSMPRMGHYFGRYGLSGDSDEADEDEPGQHKDSSNQQHMVSIQFKAPDWKVKEIARIKGVVELQYLGGSEIVKLSNAVPANLVKDMSQGMSFGSDSESESGQLSNPRLTELGCSFRVQMAMVQSGMTTLAMETGGGQSTLVDVQVFDAEGHPWPTTLIQQDAGGENRSCQVMVAGQPKPPFSFGLLLSSTGASVQVPVLVEKVSVGNK
jgi:hypothetical protein